MRLASQYHEIMVARTGRKMKGRSSITAVKTCIENQVFNHKEGRTWGAFK